MYEILLYCINKQHCKPFHIFILIEKPVRTLALQAFKGSATMKNDLLHKAAITVLMQSFKLLFTINHATS